MNKNNNKHKSDIFIIIRGEWELVTFTQLDLFNVLKKQNNVKSSFTFIWVIYEMYKVSPLLSSSFRRSVSNFTELRTNVFY